MVVALFAPSLELLLKSKARGVLCAGAEFPEEVVIAAITPFRRKDERANARARLRARVDLQQGVKNHGDARVRQNHVAGADEAQELGQERSERGRSHDALQGVEVALRVGGSRGRGEQG